MSRSQLLSQWTLMFAWTACQGIAFAEEPVERFLVRMREASLHSMAANYLDSVTKAGLVPDSLKNDIPLEKLILLNDSTATMRSPEERALRSTTIEKGFKEFLATNANHPRRSEARIQLADLLLNRGQESLRKSTAPDVSEPDREAARKSFEEARKLFESTKVELTPILEQLKGNKADNANKVAERERLQGEYRQAEILHGLSAKFMGETYAVETAEFKKWLEKSDSELTEVVKKTNTNREGGRHTLSRLYLGQVQAILGKTDEAYDNLIRVTEIEESGPFRTWRVQATSALVRLQLKSSQPKFEPIINKAETLLKTAQGGEKWTPDWLDLQLAIAEGELAWSTALESQPNGQSRSKSVKSDARGILQAIAKRPGPHREKSRALLASIGIEAIPKTDEKIPEVKKFADGLASARERFDRVNSNNMSSEILRNRKKVAPTEEQATIDEEIKKNESASLNDIRVAEMLLRKAIPLFAKEDSREELARARYFLSFALLKREAFWESAAVADFLTRGGGDAGLDAGRFALFSYGKLLEKDGKGQESPLAKSLESLAAFMLNTWPNAKESEEAATTLIQQASSDNRWEDVERYIAMLPKEGVKPSQIRREIGVILYARHLIAVDKKRRASEVPSEEDKGALVRAESMLTSGWNGLTKESLDQRAVECGNSLASIYMKSDRLSDAEKLLKKMDMGPLVAIHSSLELEPRVKMETLRLHLQSMVLAASSGGAKLETKTIADIVAEMRKYAAESPEGVGRLTDSLVQLSRDLQDQSNQVKNPTDKIKLSEGIQVLLEQLVAVSEDVNILEWAGSTLNTLGQGMEESPATQPQSVQLTKGAVRAFTKLMQLESKKPGTVKDAGRKVEDVQTKFAQALRGQGDFQGAIDKLEEALASNPKSLMPQFEAAKTYQLWGQSAKSAEYYRKAIEGNKKSIWGWGLLSKNLTKAPNLLEYFFEARYHLAECRYNSGLLENDAAKKKKAFEFSVGDLRSTAIQFPKIKESPWHNSMDQLLRKLQSDLGKPQVGMQEFYAEPTK